MKQIAIAGALVCTQFYAASSAIAAVNVDIREAVPGVVYATPAPVYAGAGPLYVVPSSRYSPYRAESEQREESWRNRRWRAQEEHSDQGHRRHEEHSQHRHEG